MRSVRCPWCGRENVSDAQYCAFCGLALKTEVALEALAVKQDLESLLDTLLKDPEVQAAIERALVRLLSKMREGGAFSF